ncbi:MAG: MarR family transcriptional regulator [Paraclostridium bifermentans]|uniref:MarR family winged helix-turn-helix transcriptional regulator n=1 Tax=Paraclostridium bifermentans TaxID=1490 RepID=UPI0011DDB659|nr:MarR family transcriptional regulator [Paraclostridium bifermentans]MBS6508547.1 MarR family transcriptional regulator [Paraclostridium bifermentans]MDU3803027.1 MarR family transcriptional regulator [Paraclostridium bifermentans]
MNSNFQSLNIIDLISEKHAKLRKMVIETWVEMGEERITDTESYMLALIEKDKLTVAQIGRIIGISRQGAHKCAKGLIEREYIMIENKDINSRDKVLCLTEKGLTFCKETLILKEKFQNEIINSIGEEKFKILKDCLIQNWFETY